MGWNRLRTFALVAAVALVSTLVVVPAFGSGHEEVVDAVEFTAVDGTAKFLYGGLTQVLTTDKNGCQIQGPAGGTVLSLAGDGGPPGLSGLSIGIRTNGKNANGTPCSQVDSKETLTIKPGSQLGDAMFSKVRLDLEVTKNAIVKLTLSDGGDNPEEFFLRTGTNATASNDTTAPFEVISDGNNRTGNCAATTSSGPNSHANDNCIWTVDPGFYFDTVELTVDPESPDGTVSLEGGSDTGADNTTLFYVVRQLNCDDPKLFEEDGEPTYKVLPKNGIAGCEKDYTYEASSGTDGDQFVKLITSGSGLVVFLEKLEFLPQAASETSGSVFGRELYYDDVLGVGTEKPAQLCLLDPRVGAGTDSPSFDLADPYYSAAGKDAVLPHGETTCIISAEFVTVDGGAAGPLVKATYYLYNLDDGLRTFK